MVDGEPITFTAWNVTLSVPSKHVPGKVATLRVMLQQGGAQHGSTKETDKREQRTKELVTKWTKSKKRLISRVEDKAGAIEATDKRFLHQKNVSHNTCFIAYLFFWKVILSCSCSGVSIPQWTFLHPCVSTSKSGEIDIIKPWYEERAAAPAAAPAHVIGHAVRLLHSSSYF